MVKKPGSGHTPDSARVPTTKGSQIHGLPRSPHAEQVVVEHVDHDAGAEEEQGLEHAVGDQVQEPGLGAAAPAAAIM